MNCDDYLAVLSTLPLEELAHGSAPYHAAQCRDCDRITRVVAERERNLRMAYAGLEQSIPAWQLAERAQLLSRRRTIARYYRIGLGVAGVVATFLFWFMSRLAPAPSPGVTVSETFRLQCLSPEQAAEVIKPHVSTTGRVTFRPSSPLGTIDVEASPKEMARARSVLERYDDAARSQCAARVTVPEGQ